MLSQKELDREARRYCIERHMYTYAGRGRTDKPTYVCWSTPVVVVPNSNMEPVASGLGYWKTSFTNGPRFRMTLYTPSTFHIKVGEHWTP